MDGPYPRIPLLTVFWDFLIGFFSSDGKTAAEEMAETCQVPSLPDWKAGCIGPFYGNEYDALPCDVSACAPRRLRKVRLPEMPWREGDEFTDPVSGWRYRCTEFGWLRVQSS